MAETGVRVTTKRRFGQFLIRKSPTVEVDGVPLGQARWREPAFFATAPGPHRVTASFSYLGRQRTGEATADVDVPAGETVALLYRSPWIVTNKGSLTVG